jgi:integrase/recombinase XerD
MAGGTVMKKKKLSNGPFGGFINKYLQLRRVLGFILIGTEITLNNFDLYISQRFPYVKTVTKPMIVGYLRTLNHLQGSTLYLRFMHLRQFCRFLFKLNPDTYVPKTTLIRRGPTVRQAHIYTIDELTELIKLARTLPPKGSLRPHTYSTLLSLLWVSGLRIGEALRLNLEDVDTDNAILHIRESKFFKSRLVPLTLSATSALETYRSHREQHCYDQRPNAPFFVNGRAKRCSLSSVDITFRGLTRHLGIRTVQGRNPRLHDFRHTFATRYLSELYQAGKNPNASLPLLATYLGHVDIACTQIYLHPSAGLLATAGQRFREHFCKSDSSLKGDRHEGI